MNLVYILPLKPCPGAVVKLPVGAEERWGPAAVGKPKQLQIQFALVQPTKDFAPTTLDLMERYFSIICEFSVKLIPLNVMLRAQLFLPL